MRDRLVELIVNADTYDSYECKLCTKDEDACNCCYAEKLADYLLANGVIVPKVKVGQTIYRCDFILHKVADWSIVRIVVCEEGILYCDDSFNAFIDEEIGMAVFLTKEEAERALKGGAE